MKRHHLIEKTERVAVLRPKTVGRGRVAELDEQDFMPLMRLFAEDPMRAVHLRGLIEDHGVCSPAHRGRIVGYYEGDRLVNAALLGHHILIYREYEGLAEFAKAAAEMEADGHLILGPHSQVEQFWSYLRPYGRRTRRLCPLLWYVCRKPRFAVDTLRLTLATTDQFDEIAPVQAHLVREQCGSDPRDNDLEGFRQRVRERILRQRTWVMMEAGEVIFKAELVRETPEAVYFESVWTRPDDRGKGVATSCVSELVNRFLFKKKAVCLLAAPDEEAACHIYQRVGFVHEKTYQARFLEPLA